MCITDLCILKYSSSIIIQRQKTMEGWNEKKGELKKKLIVLLESDKSPVEDQQEDIIPKLQENTGKTNEEMLRIINEL